jgi:hypothetical protein
MDDRMAGGCEVIRDERTMAAPPHRFGAHECNPFRLRSTNDLVNTLPERIGLHIVGVPPKGPILPRYIGRIRKRSAAAAEVGNGFIPHLARSECFRERLLVKVGIAAGGRKPAYIGKATDSGTGKDIKKFGKRSG